MATHGGKRAGAGRKPSKVSAAAPGKTRRICLFRPSKSARTIGADNVIGLSMVAFSCDLGRDGISARGK
ncbi:hypothetical protein SAMN04515666_101767 [Bosea lupini]|uniref:Uncharacterized protein n=1 Tax=Bosea lupini TaxID=1036779 RepID=A0A1H7HUT9_9HYPH|nr:hypothetical protein SAMN04515666_101767 [Bosea lupini]